MPLFGGSLHSNDHAKANSWPNLQEINRNTDEACYIRLYAEAHDLAGRDFQFQPGGKNYCPRRA